MAKVPRPRVVAKQSLADLDLPVQVTLSLAELAASAKEHLVRERPGRTYDASNRLTSDGTQPYLWDGADRLAQRGSETFTFDPLGRLTNYSSLTAVYGYLYDGDGLLRQRLNEGPPPVGPGEPPAPPDPTYLWDTAAAPARLVAAGGDRVVYGLGPLYGVRPDGSTYTLARDGLGSVRAELGDAGAASAVFRYWSYGWPQAGGTPTLVGFAGEIRDEVTGLIYLRARWYDPGVGRFASRDAFKGTLYRPASMNGFAYLEGRPTWGIDPSGLEPQEGMDQSAVIASIVASSSSFTWQGIESTISGSLFGGYLRVSFGVVRTANGQFGATFTYGGGGTTSVVGLSGGVGPIFSNARSVSDYGGVFGEIGGGGGIGLGGSVNAALGTTSDGYTVVVIHPEATVGANVTVLGVAPLPAYGYGGATNTIWTTLQ